MKRASETMNGTQPAYQLELSPVGDWGGPSGEHTPGMSQSRLEGAGIVIHQFSSSPSKTEVLLPGKLISLHFHSTFACELKVVQWPEKRQRISIAGIWKPDVLHQ